MRKLASQVLIALPVLLVACNKTNHRIEQQKKKAETYQAEISTRKYHITAFYSDKPVDYITTDSIVKRETDLWPYVQPYLLDDTNEIAPGGVLNIYQNVTKINLTDSAILHRSYAFTNDANTVYFDFVDYFYKPLRYKVSAMDSNSILIYVDWTDGAKLYSKFSRLP